MGEEEQATQSSETTGESSEKTPEQETRSTGSESHTKGEGKTYSGTSTGSISEELATQAASETSTDEQSGVGEGEGAGDEGRSESGVPDKYESFNRPDDFAWSDDTNDAFSEVMKGSKLGQKDAQSVMDFVTQHATDSVIPALLERQNDEYAKHRDRELEAAKQDPRLVGEDGEQWDSTMALVNKVIERFSGPGKEAEGTIAALKDGGFLDQHNFLVLLSQIGGAMTSDTLAGGDDPLLSSDDDWEKMTIGERLAHADKLEAQKEESAA